MVAEKDSHEFMVSGVEHATDMMVDGIAIRLSDARGGQVRLHLSTEMAQVLCDKIKEALARD